MRLTLCLLLPALSPLSAAGSLLRISPGSTVRSAAEGEANYSTTHLYVDETVGESIPVTVFFDPQMLGVQTAEVFTNLNRRDRAEADANGDGVPDGILPVNGNTILAGSDAHYFRAWTMTGVPGGYQITLPATKTGAYRLTARWRLTSDAPGTWRYYNDELASGLNKRDHAIVISPRKARDMVIYELNPLTITATGSTAGTRGTFATLANGPGGVNRFSLDYVKSLGANMLWFQPFHPNGIDGRQMDPATGQPYEVGSPYAVKNFFEVMPLMASTFTPGSTPASNDTAAGRAAAMAEFQSFAAAADSKEVDLMIDAPFNHTSYDVELGSYGQTFWGNAGSTALSQIRNTEARFFARTNAYDRRAFSAASIATAPDRNEFTFEDTYEIYFGRYAALVPNDSSGPLYLNEGDWFDYSIGQENNGGDGHGHFDAVTRNVWKYFALYLDHWLTQTGYPANPSGASLASTAGIDGLRADFAQGLPPQAWEYLINRTRARKWNFIFMAESLDGGAVTYRSGRHFDVLNENIVFPLHAATTTTAFRNIYESRRNAYGQAGVLLNTSSHDEDHYQDPWQALIRYAVNSTVDGAPMIFPGQELGLSGTIIPPASTNAGLGTFGYERYEINFGKPIPHFKKFNSLMPLWRKTTPSDPGFNFGLAQLQPVYAAIGQARRNSPALRSPNRFFLDAVGGATPASLYGVAKYETAKGSPALTDVVFAFVNLDRNNARSATFNVSAQADGTSLFGLKPGRLYNTANLSRHAGGASPLLWGSGRSGSVVLANGIFVSLNAVPVTYAAWATAPYEPQYLRLLDTTAPLLNAPVPLFPNNFPYVLAGAVTLTWPALPADSEGVVPAYQLRLSRHASAPETYSATGTSLTLTATAGEILSATLQAVNPHDATQGSAISAATTGVRVLDSMGDEDADGSLNAAEQLAGTNPLDAASLFTLTSSVRQPDGSQQLSWTTVPGRSYQVTASPTLTNFQPVSAVLTSGTFTLPANTVDNRMFYRVEIVPAP